MCIEMKNDLLTIGSVTIHGYGLMIGIGILCCVFMGMKRAKKRGMSEDAVLDIAIFSVIGGFIGAKLLFVIVEFKDFLKNPLQLLGSEGFVVYGGIITGVLVAMLYCKKKKLVFLEYFDLLVPSVALAQGFGRIGCFLAGCCYGRETDSFLGVVFPEGSIAPAGIKLLPTQLFSSAGNFLIVIILLLYGRKKRKAGSVGLLYVLLYSVGRFFIEFLRFDDRGFVGVLSTSQIISLILLAVLAVVFIIRRKQNGNGAAV